MASVQPGLPATTSWGLLFQKAGMSFIFTLVKKTLPCKAGFDEEVMCHGTELTATGAGAAGWQLWAWEVKGSAGIATDQPSPSASPVTLWGEPCSPVKEPQTGHQKTWLSSQLGHKLTVIWGK